MEAFRRYWTRRRSPAIHALLAAFVAGFFAAGAAEASDSASAELKPDAKLPQEKGAAGDVSSGSAWVSGGVFPPTVTGG